MFSRRFLRIKVIKALYAHFKSLSDSMVTSEKNLMYSIDKSYDLYFQMLILISDVRRYALDRIELAKNKKLPTHEDLNPNTRFVENEAVVQIGDSEELNKVLEKKSLGWHRDPELIKNLYNSMIGSDYYKTYMSKPTTNYRDDVEFVQDFYINTVQDNELMESVVESQSIMFSDDVDFILIMVMKTLDNFRQTQRDIPFQKQYKSDEDTYFVKELFRQTIVHFGEYQAYIERFTKNWDVERLAFLDNLIMAAAMAELIGFESIPVKVTLDEYIEIAKYYSTPGSSLFINGVLDKIVESLQSEGRINKTGRGLLG